MGKAQSKRSVDITTETKKGSDDEVTEKMEKIEDTDRKEVNGDATIDPQLEKKDNDDAENDKDTTTEKSDDAQAGGDSGEPCKSSIAESTKEDGTASEEISPLTDDSAKKSKKEKVKKKWSFRNMSFGKKDKQKPLKTEESNENAGATTNGTDEEKSSQDTEESQKDKENAINSPDEASMEVHENGTATEQENTEEQTEEMSSDVKSNEETVNKINPTAEKSENVTIETAENLTSQETDTTSNTPPKSDVIDIETKSEENVISDASTNERNVEEINATVKQPTKDEAAGGEVTAENKNIPADMKVDTVTVNGNVDEIHQNGSDNVSHQDVEETKAQIEVKSNTDNKASADSLEIISSSTYNNPPNVQVHDKHVNTLGENFEDVGMEKDVEHEISNSINELCNRTDAGTDEKDLNVEKVESNVVKPFSDEKLGHEPSPPPLPISPPPSHVSVFAFTNKEESADDSLGKTEPISTQMEDLEDHKPATTPLSPTEISEQHSNIDDVFTTDNSNSGNQNEEQFETKICFQNNDLPILVLHPCIESELKSTIPESEQNDAMENAELQNVEKEIYIEVLEHQNNNSLINDFKPIDDNNTLEHLQIEYEGVEEIENNEVLENMSLNLAKEKDVELLNLKNNDLNKNCENTDLNSENNLQNQLQETCLYTKEDNAKNVECENENNAQSHNLDQSEADDEITQLNTHHEAQKHDNTVFDKIDNLVREETKEITNTKDLKESATVAEVTQDPSVTCE